MNLHAAVTGYTDAERLALAIDLHEDLAKTIRAWGAAQVAPAGLTERAARFFVELAEEIGSQAWRVQLDLAEEMRDDLALLS